MKRLINQIFIIPFLFFFFTFVSFGVYYFFFINEITQKELTKAKDIVIQNKKNYLKIELDSIIKAIEEIRLSNYLLTERNLQALLDVVLHNYKYYSKGFVKFFKNHQNKDLFFYIESENIIYPKLKRTYIKVRHIKHLIVIKNNVKYLAVEKRLRDGTIIGIAFKLSIVDDFIKRNMFRYLENVNNPRSYIAVGMVTDWNPKGDVFGKVVYHPIKSIIGKPLLLNKPDIKGNYFRKKYFNCLKVKDSCFLEYFYKNPLTGKVEKKISYFTIYRPYNLTFMKGYYFSDITKDINSIKSQIEKEAKKVFIGTIIIMIIFGAFSFFVAYLISQKIMKRIVEDYEKLKNNYEKSKALLYEKVYFDRVTKLPNKFKLLEDLKEYKSLIIIDIDDFANINNLYGFKFGNYILNCVATTLKENFDKVYKIGDDEFGIPFKEEIKEEFLKEFSSLELKCEGFELMFTIGASNIKDLYITAENALKTARKKNIKYLLYDKKFKEEQLHKVKLLQKLKTILHNEDIEPYYQCIVDKSGKLLKYESLMRLKYKSEILSPFVFMDLIKEARLYEEFSNIMIKKVFSHLVTQKIDKVSINLSFIDIANKETRTLILNLLRSFFVGDRITFEILESESIQNFEEIKKFIKDVKQFGAEIAIDDFGSGYSNFINVLALEPDYVKIDGTLVKNIDKEEYFEIIKLICTFSKKFNIKTIAEFVENEEILNKLKEVGVDYFQGYYFCKPLPFDKIALKKGNYET
ncbi:MAG: EAL domain-containing protein [Nautiliaceae bacterium]